MSTRRLTGSATGLLGFGDAEGVSTRAQSCSQCSPCSCSCPSGGSGAAQDCTDTFTRGGRGAQCWLGQPNAVPLKAVAVVLLRLQDIAAQNTGFERSASYVPGTAASCRDLNNLPFSIDFLFVRGANAMGTSARAAVILDTVGPNPPEGVVASIQGTTTTVDWQPASAPSDIASYRVYCDERAEGATGTSSTLEAGTPPPADRQPCASTVLQEAQLPNRTSERSVYAVAALDNLGNPGPLSNLACPTKALDVTGNLDGLGGGGCSAAAGPLGASSALLTVLALVAARRRRNASA